MFGCAGQGTFSGTTPYVGSYSGAWTSPGTGHSGTMTMTISPHAQIVGTFVDSTDGTSGAMSGNVTQSGGFKINVKLAGGGADTLKGVFSITGTTLSGDGTIASATGTQGMTLTLTSGTTTTGNSPYAGSFSGGWASGTNGHSGTLSLTISTNSTVVGSFSDATSGFSGAVTGSVSSTGALTAAIGTGGTLNGQLTITGTGTTGVLSGNATATGGGTTEGIAFSLPTFSTNSPYAGSFSGGWTSATSGHSGTLSLTIGSNSSVTGTYTDTTANVNGTVAGSVSVSGQLSASVATSATTSSTLTGQLSITGTGASAAISGNATVAGGGSSQGISFNLGAAGTNSSFVGSYTGGWHSATNNHDGTFSVTVTNSSTILGAYKDTTSGTAGIVNGSVNPNGSFNASITLTTGAVLPFTGSIAVAGSGTTAELTGNGILNTGTNQELTFLLPLQVDANGYIGVFNGTWATSLPLNGIGQGNVNGNLSYVVAPDGSFIGSFVYSNGTGTLFGNVDTNGKYSFTLTTAGTTGTVLATLTGIMTYATTTTPGVGAEDASGTMTANNVTVPFIFDTLGTAHSAIKIKQAGATTRKK